MEKPKVPDLAGFLAGVPDIDRLASLRDAFASRASLLAREGDDPERQSWASLYGFLSVEVETALLRKQGITL